MKKKILVSAPMDFVDIDESIDEDLLIFESLSEVDSMKTLDNKELIFSWIVSPCPTYLIDKQITSFLPNLRSVVTPSTGTNHIDKQSLESIGIKVYSLRDSELYNSILASSEYSFSLILSLIRKIPKASQFPIQGRWRESEDYLRSREVNTLKLGIVGLGRIGKNVANYASSMGMDIIYFDPFVLNESYKKIKSIKEIFQTCDVVLLSPILNDETEDLITKEVLSNSKKGLLLVNTSRGEIIDENAVADLVKNNTLGGFAADVLRGEIDGSWKNSPILELSKKGYNVVVTPHIAGLTFDSETKAQNIALHLASKSIEA
tara:strand:+ start:2909 stop:3862 length:954 start_codon:yes stop_codon:yes gene_type:complete